MPPGDDRPPPQKLLVAEVWEAARPTIKLLLGDVLTFAVIMAVFALGHFLFSTMPLTDHQRRSVERWHFISTMALWMWLSLILLVDIALKSLLRVKEGVLAVEGEGHDRPE